MTDTRNLLVTDRKKIREHWKKSDAQIEMEIGIIKNWLKTQKHLPETPSDNTIEYCLTNCKFSIEKTKRTLDMYYTIRKILPDLYENKHPCLQHMKNVQNVIYLCPMPHLTYNLYRINVIKLKDVDPDLFQIYDNTSMFLRNFFEIKNREDLALGEILVMDLQYLKLEHLIKTTPIYTKKCALVLEKVWANRLKEVHMLNPPSYVDHLLALAKAFLSKKLHDRIYIHKEVHDIFKYVPQELMASDYGGNQPSLQEIQDLWTKKLEEYKERFDVMETLTVNEALRPEKLIDSDILGFHGNFKTIDID